MSLPPHNDHQTYYRVSAIDGGTFTLPLNYVLEGRSDKMTTPSLSFVLRSSSPDRTILFDLGIRKDLAGYPPAVHHITKICEPRVSLDVAQSLASGGVDPSVVDYVIYSHLHWDHVGDPTPFKNATILLGGESTKMCVPGYPHDTHSTVAADLLPPDSTQFISQASGTWAPLGPFPRALDFFGDGSAYLVDAPGHCPGHMNLLARTSPDGGWIYLAGDSAHDRSLIRGDGSFALRRDEAGNVKGALMHMDLQDAEDTLERIAALTKYPRVQVIIAHDTEWWEENKGGPAFWPGEIASL